tara:strand:- start:173 stop:427 length:255 start_codon:yes stop_codon:yes gene_type:complete
VFQPAKFFLAPTTYFRMTTSIRLSQYASAETREMIRLRNFKMTSLPWGDATANLDTGQSAFPIPPRGQLSTVRNSLQDVRPGSC